MRLIRSTYLTATQQVVLNCSNTALLQSLRPISPRAQEEKSSHAIAHKNIACASILLFSFRGYWNRLESISSIASSPCIPAPSTSPRSAPNKQYACSSTVTYPFSLTTAHKKWCAWVFWTMPLTASWTRRELVNARSWSDQARRWSFASSKWCRNMVSAPY